MEPAKRKKPNLLMLNLIVFSLAIHAFLFLYLAGIYRSGNTSYIELSMQNVVKPQQRLIPRPRPRHTAPAIQKVVRPVFRRFEIPQIVVDPNPQQADNRLAFPPQSGKKGLSDAVHLDNSIHHASTQIQAPPIMPVSTTTGNFLSRKDYLEMVMFKIESKKKYPAAARSNRMEGRVKVSFIITASGHVSSLKIIRKAGHDSLNHAALAAIHNASPFPTPPAGMFEGPINVSLTIIFELR